jgi:hypothetical protein
MLDAGLNSYRFDPLAHGLRVVGRCGSALTIPASTSAHFSSAARFSLS